MLPEALIETSFILIIIVIRIDCSLPWTKPLKADITYLKNIFEIGVVWYEDIQIIRDILGEGGFENVLKKFRVLFECS